MAHILPPTNLLAAFQDLANVPQDLPTEEALRVEIEKLDAATLEIDQAFCKFEGELSDVTVSKEQNKHVDLRDTRRVLETQWKEHHRTYIKLLWRSREFGGETQALVDDFREMALPSLRDQMETPEEKQQLIREQMELMQETVRSSEQICQGFIDFSGTLGKYIEEFPRIVEGLKIGEQAHKVGGLKEKLNDAESAMESVTREVTPSLFASAKLAIADVMIAVLSTDCLQIKDSGVNFLEARKRYNLAVADYDSVKAKYDSEITCLDQIVNLESTLQDARPLVQEVTMKLGIFASVWAAITADILHRVNNWLRLSDNPASQLFVLRVQNLEKMYGYLSQALRHYQVTVRLPDHARRDMVGLGGRV